MEINKLGRQRGQSVIMPFRPAECDCQVLPFDKSEIDLGLVGRRRSTSEDFSPQAIDC